MKEPLNSLQRVVVDAAAEKKADDILILDLRNRSDLTDFFMICSGNSKAQVQAITDSIREKIYKTDYKLSAVEGYSAGNWVVVDLGDIFVHVFHKDARNHYDLERLWGDVPVIKAVGQ
ncbi:MAG: ribosomal silencing factor RsfS [Nitrospinaceae bacterium]|nr:MAG: ribosomal silencing factor RsfS [Nitrospinaceae bacterium]